MLDDFSDWQRIIAFRNVIAHAYDVIDDELERDECNAIPLRAVVLFAGNLVGTGRVYKDLR